METKKSEVEEVLDELQMMATEEFGEKTVKFEKFTKDELEQPN